MGNDQDATRWIRAHRDAAAAAGAPTPARVAATATAATATAPATLSVIDGGSPDSRPAGNRPRINRRAMAAASAMRDAAGGAPER
jgi:hypothetical protein